MSEIYLNSLRKIGKCGFSVTYLGFKYHRNIWGSLSKMLTLGVKEKLSFNLTTKYPDSNLF